MPRPNLAEAAWKDTSVALMLKEPGWGSPGCFHLEKLAGPQTRTVSPERTGSQHSEPASPVPVWAGPPCAGPGPPGAPGCVGRGC